MNKSVAQNPKREIILYEYMFINNVSTNNDMNIVSQWLCKYKWKVNSNKLLNQKY